MPEVKRRRKLRQVLSAFPGGGPGMALVLLRLTLGLTGITEGVSIATRGSDLASQCLGIILGSAGAFVAIGLYTSVSATAAATSILCGALFLVDVPRFVLLQSWPTAAIVIVLALAIALLGPGLFSIDARLFGRREIIIPRRPRE
jgi:uncharacterized membrane protein YphA (DoxX/SURF4 family)